MHAVDAQHSVALLEKPLRPEVGGQVFDTDGAVGVGRGEVEAEAGIAMVLDLDMPLQRHALVAGIARHPKGKVEAITGVAGKHARDVVERPLYH